MLNHPETFYGSPPAGYDGLFDWDFLKKAGCFGDTNIEPMDLDGIVERKGRFLVFETKNPGVEIPKGQEITLRALARTELFTVFLIQGKRPGEFTSLEIWDGPGNKTYGPMSADEDTIIYNTAAWFRWADNRGASYELR